MIARSWRAVATPAGADRYDEHFRTSVLADLRTTPGFLRAYLMRRPDGGEVRIHVVTLWESMDAIAGFAGATPDSAVVEPEARAALLRFDETVDHYETTEFP
jgi:heme-degrading monooxygenase HmoA